MKRTARRLSCLLALVLLATLLCAPTASASAPTDVIEEYYITADVNADASVTLNYHIKWKVLESDSAGPLSWVLVGIPNRHYESYEPLSPSIDKMSYSSSDGSFLKIYLDRKYYEGETVDIDFSLVQNYTYQVNKLTEGETVVSFTPGWFDDIEVEDLQIRWNSREAVMWSPECAMEKGYLVWSTTLVKGERFTVSVTYPNEAFAFDLTRTGEPSSGSETSLLEDFLELLFGLVLIAVCMGIMFLPLGIAVYVFGRGFKAAADKKQKVIKRTLVQYYDSCPGCGAVRQPKTTVCSYCGRDLVKSEEIIHEEDVVDPKKYSHEGEYRYSTIPNTYIRVHVTHVPAPRPVSAPGNSASSHRSSCACASSCACTCACACAGGGRAGCSTKDFYSTRLKLEQLKRKRR